MNGRRVWSGTSAWTVGTRQQMPWRMYLLADARITPPPLAWAVPARKNGFSTGDSSLPSSLDAARCKSAWVARAVSFPAVAYRLYCRSVVPHYTLCSLYVAAPPSARLTWDGPVNRTEGAVVRYLRRVSGVACVLLLARGRATALYPLNLYLKARVTVRLGARSMLRLIRGARCKHLVPYYPRRC